MSLPLILWYGPEDTPAQVSEQDFAACCKTLGAAGFERVSCKNASQLLSKAALLSRRRVPNANGSPPRMFAVLCGMLAENAALAHLLRTDFPHMGIAAFVPDLHEDTQLLALQSGIDIYFTPTASDHLVVAGVFSLLRRMAGIAPIVSVPNASPAWRFAENAWKLVSPEGEEVALTTTERAFMLALASSQERSATHEQLLKAAGSFLATEAEGAKRERLSVLVSRLRRKFQARNLELPVRSLHGTGYMFVGPMA